MTIHFIEEERFFYPERTVIEGEYEVLKITDIQGAGGGGKGGGGGSAPYEAPNTLHSYQIVSVLLALGEGEIQGVDNVYLNGTPISAFGLPNTLDNFIGAKINYQIRTGTLTQGMIAGFSDVETPYGGTFPVPLLYNVNTHQYTMQYYENRARVTLQVQSLEKVTSNGDRLGYSVSHNIYVQTYINGVGAGTGWVLAVTSGKNGKATAPYAWDLYVSRPSDCNPTDTWAISIIRTSIDETSDQYNNLSFIQQITKIQDKSLTYPYTALIGISFNNAAQFGGSVPDIKVKMKGIKLFLPTTYTPVTRFYNDAVTPWDGSFKTIEEYTDNLSWVIFWCLQHSRWGLGIAQADLDIGSFYLFAKYCDQLVADGGGATEPRYTIHYQFLQRDNVPTFLTYLQNLGNCNFTTNEFGQIKIVWDGAGQVITKIESNATVLDSMFDYSSNDLENRITSCNVTFADPLLYGDTNTTTWTDSGLVARYGLQTADVILQGCQSEAQALRKARWVVWTNAVDTTIVTFKKLFNGAVYTVGELVNIMDSDNIDITAHHALITNFSVAGSVTTLNLDRTLHLPAVLNNSAGTPTTVAYTAVELLLQQSDGSTIFAEVNTNQVSGDTAVFTVNSVLTTPIIGTTLLVKHFDNTGNALLAPRTVKVTKIEKSEDVYTITCVQHTEAKYAYIENVGTVTVPNNTGNFVNFNSFDVPAPVNVVISERFFSDGIRNAAHLNISWDWNLSGSVKYQAIYKLSYSRDNLDAVVASDIHTKNYDIADPIPGTYFIYIWAINPFTGIPSTVLQVTYMYRTVAGTSTLNPPTNLRVTGTTGGTFNSKDCLLSWDYPTSNFATGVKDKLLDYIIEVRDYTTSAVVFSDVVLPDTTFNGSYNFTFSQNSTAFAGTPNRQFRVKVYCRDLIGDISTGTELVSNNPTPSHLNFTFVIANGLGSEYFDISQNTPEPDIVGYIIAIQPGTSAPTSFTGATYNDVGMNTVPSIATTVPQYYAIAAYDSFGKIGLDYSSWVLGTPATFDVAKYTYAGLTFTPNSPAANQISWPSFTVSRNGGTPVTVAAGNATWSAGSLYIYINDTFNDGTAFTMDSTNTLSVGVTKTQILATYYGGLTMASGDGSAFIDGGQVVTRSLAANALIANSLTANELVTGTAVITTEAQIASAVINKGHIKDYLASTNYNATLHTGWKLETGNSGGTPAFDIYGNLTVYDTSGNVILASGGTTPGVQWGKIIGAGKAADNATVGATIGTNLYGQMNSGNISTWIANGAIGNLQFDRATGNKLSVGTLDIEGNAVTVPGFNTNNAGAVSVGMTLYAGTNVVVRGYSQSYLSSSGAQIMNILLGSPGFANWTTVKSQYVFGGNDVGAQSSPTMAWQFVIPYDGWWAFAVTVSGEVSSEVDIEVLGVRR